MEDLLANGCNLDRLHPNASAGEVLTSPVELIDGILARQQRVTTLLQVLREKMDAFSRATEDAPVHRFGDIAPLQRRPAIVDPNQEYPQVSVRSFGRGTFHKPPLVGSEITWEKPHLVKNGDIVISNIKAWEGAVAVASAEDDGRYGSHRYLTCVPVPNVVTARYISIPVPPYASQLWFDEIWDILSELRRLQSSATSAGEELLPAIFAWAYPSKAIAQQTDPKKKRVGASA